MKCIVFAGLLASATAFIAPAPRVSPRSVMKMGTPRPVYLLHGYLASAENLGSLKKWRDALLKRPNTGRVVLINYITLADEVSIGDIGEGFDLALQRDKREGENGDFDVIVHSTGMLVIRAWLARYAPIGVQDKNTVRQLRQNKDQSRTKRLRHIIALAPATNGSPLAHKGLSLLGKFVSAAATTIANQGWGPDFGEAGEKVLKALELASPFTWDLAEKDMFGDARFAKGPPKGPGEGPGEGPGAPFVFTICGDPGLDFILEKFPGFKWLLKSNDIKIGGSDGVVRWAGASLNSERLTVDYTGDDTSSTPIPQLSKNQDNILVLLPGLHHGTVLEPNDDLIELVTRALNVDDKEAYKDWNKSAQDLVKMKWQDMNYKPHKWQQFVIRVVDERGDGVTDWTVSLEIKLKSKESKLVEIDDVHTYELDQSYRCLHLDLTTVLELGDDHHPLELGSNVEKLDMTLTMNSRSAYSVYNINRKSFSTSEPKGQSELTVDLTYLTSKEQEFILLRPYTTTFITFRVNRDPTGKPPLVEIR